MNKRLIEQHVKNWLQHFVVGFNLCPFAHPVISNNKIKYVVSEADTENVLLQNLIAELQFLDQHPEIETSLLIHPQVLSHFDDYNQFLDLADALITDQAYEGVYQIASFHPDYQFADTEFSDNENYSNRSPYPMLHILREESLASAIASHPNPEAIPERNIKKLNSLDHAELKALFKSCFN